jgi:hypothetical protein
MSLPKYEDYEEDFLKDIATGFGFSGNTNSLKASLDGKYDLSEASLADMQGFYWRRRELVTSESNKSSCGL